MAISKCLISVVHDPNGKLVKPFYSEFLKIAQLFDKTIVEATSETSGFYDAYNYFYIYLPDSLGDDHSLGDARRRVLQSGVNSGCDIIFFCDFDRLLYWWLMYPNELKVHIANLPEDRFIIFGRTKPAMDSHPEVQRITEGLCNLLFSYEFGDYDILAACRSIPREVAVDILDNSTVTNPACIDAEWPMIAGWDNTEYVKVNGLGYESDLFDIAREWNDEVKVRIENLEELAEWLNR